MRYSSRTQRLYVSDNTNHNLFRISGDDFYLEEIDGTNKGGNSSVFRAQHPDGDESYIVKFCRYRRESEYPRDQRRIERFEREITALRMARASKEWGNCVIPMVDDGVRPILVDGERSTLRYYVMEEAESDLRGFLEQNDLSIQQKLLLCSDLIEMLKGLHSLGIYHRDIKPSNILIFNGRPIFADLGLINFRAQDSDIDEFDEKVGPIGYLSPEATNKHLAIRDRVSFSFDCWIDEKSDLFQLGQVFWLVLQDEVPVGHLANEDLKIICGEILDNVVRPMLQYGKIRRASLSSIEQALSPIMKEFAVV